MDLTTLKEILTAFSPVIGVIGALAGVGLAQRWNAQSQREQRMHERELQVARWDHERRATEEQRAAARDEQREQLEHRSTGAARERRLRAFTTLLAEADSLVTHPSARMRGPDVIRPPQTRYYAALAKARLLASDRATTGIDEFATTVESVVDGPLDGFEGKVKAYVDARDYVVSALRSDLRK